MKRLTVGSLIPGRKVQANSNPKDGFQGKTKSANTSANQHRITVKQNDNTFVIRLQKGRSMLDSALAANLPIQYKCKKGTCGKCEVAVQTGGEQLTNPGSAEKQKLTGREKEGHRLACQAYPR